MAKGKRTDIRSELIDAKSELEKEVDSEQKSSDQKLAGMAKKLLQLERDLAVPGSGVSDHARVQRILDAIEEENF